MAEEILHCSNSHRLDILEETKNSFDRKDKTTAEATAEVTFRSHSTTSIVQGSRPSLLPKLVFSSRLLLYTSLLDLPDEPVSDPVWSAQAAAHHKAGTQLLQRYTDRSYRNTYKAWWIHRRLVNCPYLSCSNFDTLDAICLSEGPQVKE